MKITAISDTHTLHRELELPGGDLLIHAGDIMGSGNNLGEIVDFLDWFQAQPYEHHIFIAGNHDRIFEEQPELMETILREQYPDVIYLQDSGVTIDGINFYGSPWTPAFCGWAFQLHNDYEDTEICRKIPDDTDVLITHGPAHGYLDQVETFGVFGDHLGSKGLRNWIDTNNPKFHICGHIHTGHGVLDGYGEVTTHINAACLGEDYKFTNRRNYIEWNL